MFPHYSYFICFSTNTFTLFVFLSIILFFLKVLSFLTGLSCIFFFTFLLRPAGRASYSRSRVVLVVSFFQGLIVSLRSLACIFTDSTIRQQPDRSFIPIP